MNTDKEIEQLRSDNRRLEVTVENLKKEISNYKKDAEKLEWEKDVLNQGVERMSTLFKTWIDEVDRGPQPISNRSEKINMMVKYPCRSISELLQLNGDSVCITSCQSPYFIEYVNSRWSEECGWNSSEVLGLTCSFLQGEMTDKNMTKSFMKDIRSSGYGHMRILNYRKSGQIFEVDVTVYPIFDSICAMGPDSEVAVLTHFACVLSNFKEFDSSRICHNQDSSLSSHPIQTGSSRNSNNSLISSNNSSNNSFHNRSRIHMPSDSSKFLISQTYHNSATDFHNRVNLLELSRQEIVPGSHMAPIMNKTQDCNSSNKDGIGNDSYLTEKINTPIVANSSIENIGTDSDPISTLSTSSIPAPSSTIENNSCRGNDSNPISNISENGYSECCDSVSDGSSHCNNNNIFNDRRNLESRFVAKCGILSENFYQFGNTLRLSNLLRLMLSSQDAMGLMDSSGRFIHVNVAWSTLTGYELNELEGRTLTLLEGTGTDVNAIRLYRQAMEERRAVEVKLLHYRRNGEKYFTQMTVVPIQGGYLQPNVSHYCVLCRNIQGPQTFGRNSNEDRDKYYLSATNSDLDSSSHQRDSNDFNASTDHVTLAMVSPNVSNSKRSFQQHESSYNHVHNIVISTSGSSHQNEDLPISKKFRK